MPRVPSSYSHYLDEIVTRLWQYRSSRFAGNADYFDRPGRTGSRPPVFVKEHRSDNVLVDRADPRHAHVLNSVPREARHVWYGSMKSSQALAQSYFGTLHVYGQLNLISRLMGDDGSPLFPESDNIQLERCVARKVFGEAPQSPTTIDVAFIGNPSVMHNGHILVAVECKFSEDGTGKCSKGMAAPDDSQCRITEARVRYWKFIPELFNWTPDVTCGTCLVKERYQLVRNVLAVAVQDWNTIDTSGHAVLVYDERNPEFQSGGSGMQAWTSVKEALKKPAMLQRCSWQQLVACLDGVAELAWLRGELCAKYGL
ncbi:MAG: PGN_0703 family putative restriction endonuclease [Capsulimonadaceae bacterium]